MNDLVSIVIPVYNVEQYLRRCLDSVIKQTYENIEIILVDDGTPDNSGKICDEYAEKDKRIRVIHKENGGLSDARNAGIKIANGKYITFIDSDDRVSEDYVEYLYSLLKKYNTNISICKLKVVYDDEDIKNDTLKDEKWSKSRILSDILYAKNFDVSACGKMYLTSNFENIKFPVGKLFEDNATIYKLIDLDEFVAVGFSSKYNYIIRRDSITTKDFNEKQMDLISVTDQMCEDLSKYKELKKAIKRKRFWARISTLNRMITSNNRDFEREKRLRKEIITYKSVVWDFKSSIKDKISIVLLLVGIRIYSKAWTWFKKRK